MSDTVIFVENISKRYVIGHQHDSRDGLRQQIENAFRNPFQWIRNRYEKQQASREEFWALKDVSFEIKQGEVVGIIGRNGAGKSTLLKVLSRIIEPTHGRIRLKGRVASLLEVGTGFHQELSGRENIFLNGAILGMTRAEIKRKFDEIVAFSEIEKFLDTPVKRYSSGMYVRLAFAVAAHLEPEILIVDEVLAVGDASFQKKCLGKMGQVAKGGRTVLFVSHDMSAIRTLCSKAVLLEGGTVKARGEAGEIIDQYLARQNEGNTRFVAPVPMGSGLKLIAFEFTPDPVVSGGVLRFRLEFRAEKNVTFNDLAILVNSAQNARIAVLDLRFLGFPKRVDAGQILQIAGSIRSLPLVEGDYSVGLTVSTPDFLENVFDLTGFTVTARVHGHDYTQYAVAYRGCVELEFDAKAATGASTKLEVLVE